MKRVIGILEQLEGGTGAKFSAERLQKLQVCELVAGSLADRRRAERQTR